LASRRTPDAPGTTLLFPVVQRCAVGEHRWVEVPDAANPRPRSPIATLRLGEARRVAADQQHRTRMPRQRCDERREVLPLAVAAQDDHQPRRREVGAQALQRGHGGADVGALAVVKGLHIAHAAHQLHPVRLALVLAQAVQHGGHGAAGRGGRCTGRAWWRSTRSGWGRAERRASFL
jgi:hypothetical protein